MTKQEVLSLFQGLNRMGHLKGVKFAYAVAKNVNGLKSEIEALQKATEASAEFKKFENARIALAEKHALKDEKGKAKIAGQAYDMGDNQAVFDVEFETLKKEHQVAFDARQEQIKQYGELLKGEASVTLHKIKLADVPAEINAQEMNTLYPIIEE